MSGVRYYAVKDLKVGFQVMQPFQNDEVAKRAFINAAKNPSSMLSQCPADFELWYLGEFFEENGSFVSVPEFICNIGGSNNG